MSLLRSTYYGLSWLSVPFVKGYLHWRVTKGHEDKRRLPERFGRTTLSRPRKPLVWIHAVSVGEAVAALVILQAILRRYPSAQGLITTTTVSSAKVLKDRLSKGIIHQYCPVDTPQAVRSFLNTWQPDLALWIESELWPNLLHETQERGIPTLLLNARMSEQTFANWQKLKGLISPLMQRLDLCAVQSEDQVPIFQALGAENTTLMRNVKGMMAPLKIEEDKVKALKQMIGGRPFWVAASTHPGEEESLLKTHEILSQTHSDLLTILIPRHIERAEEIQALAKRKNLSTRLKTQTTSPLNVDLLIGDTLGEMGMFYALSPTIFLGATLVPKGGHNPMEAAQLGSYIFHGPHIKNNAQLYHTLHNLGLSTQIEDEQQLAQALLPRLALQKKSYDEPPALIAYREEGLKELITLLTPYLTTLKGECS